MLGMVAQLFAQVSFLLRTLHLGRLVSCTVGYSWAGASLSCDLVLLNFLNLVQRVDSQTQTSEMDVVLQLCTSADLAVASLSLLETTLSTLLVPLKYGMGNNLFDGRIANLWPFPTRCIQSQCLCLNLVFPHCEFIGREVS